MSELTVVPVEEQISQELVKANVTEAIIASLKEKYLPLRINGTEDKETYLLVKDARKECKALRVMAEKICKKGREEAVAIQKAWVKKEKEVTDKIGEVEDYLEKQEKDFESAVAKEKEEKKRRQDEQFILRQQVLSGMGVLYADGHFTIGDVSFEMSLIKECDDDLWVNDIKPVFEEEYNKVEAERIEQERLKQEREAEIKRQQEELERKQKEMEGKEAEMKRQQDALNAQKIDTRVGQLKEVHWEGDCVMDDYNPRYVVASKIELLELNDHDWTIVVDHHNAGVDERKAAEAEEKRALQERKALQNARFSEIKPYSRFITNEALGRLGEITEEQYQELLQTVKRTHEDTEKIKAEQDRVATLKKSREDILMSSYGFKADDGIDLGTYSDDNWDTLLEEVKATYQRIQKEKWEKEQEAKRIEDERIRQEQLDQAGDKEKWAEMLNQLDAIQVFPMRSSQYRKKAMLFRIELDKLKALKDS